MNTTTPILVNVKPHLGKDAIPSEEVKKYSDFSLPVWELCHQTSLFSSLTRFSETTNM